MNPSDRSPSRQRQRGVAAIEFALIFSLLLAFIYGIATFGSVLYTQQAVSRAAEDGARALMAFNGPVTQATVTAVKGAVHDSLASSLIGPPGTVTTAARKTWLESNLTVQVNTNGLIRVIYPYSDNRMLNLSEAWVPDVIVGTARITLS
ncbi:TadE/TadG family type IV pilus assembly protein [Variovorax ginsengisoli]|uniref:Flp pilus assembly protein TadG n=1 Tax=Variovorax ginsengisoli TaxID=363844 RepID=A0ABT9SER0_9BURK|nr:TadE/TadG family type IV pilus assembly protein [Variovorax ginsengisoli]MDP9902705.1 Flp pilus assembly protein TadG [Variovorax ginsengisoli]